MNILETVKKNKEKMLEDMQGLLRIDSTLVESDSPEAPFGEGIRASLDYVLALGEQMGFKVKNVKNVAGHIEFGEGEEIVGILCHVDVVPAVGNWKYPPFPRRFLKEEFIPVVRATIKDRQSLLCMR